MTKPNRFATLIEAAKEGPEAPDGATAGTPAPPSPVPEAEARPPADTPPAPPRGGETKGPGRPRGKRSDPDFEQVSARIPSALYSRVRIAIIEDGRRQDFSEVVAELLSGWLDDRKAR